MNLRKLCMLSTLIFFTVMISNNYVLGQDEFAKADKNKDEKIDTQELSDALREVGTIAGWDANNDGYLNENEFLVAVFKIMDTDNDNLIDATEFADRLKPMVEQDENLKQYLILEEWDTNENDNIEVNELTYVLRGQELFSVVDIDSDRKLNTDEASKAVLHIMDLDNDELIEKIEFGEWTMKLDSDDN